MSKKDINKDKKKNNFLKELKAELKKVTWPTFKKLVNNTTAVISIVLILSAFVFVLDLAFESLNDFGVGKLKQLVSTNTEETTEVTEGENTSTESVETEVVENNETEGEDTTTPETTENAEESTNTEVNAETEVAE